MKFVRVDDDVTFLECIIINEKNYIESKRINKNLEQIRNGAKW